MSIRLCSWNACGFNDLKQAMMYDIRGQFDVIGIAEITRAQSIKCFPEFQELKCKSHRLSLFVSKKIEFQLLEVKDEEEFSVISILLSNDVQITYAYLRKGSSNIGIKYLLDFVQNSKYSEHVILGDLNTRSYCTGFFGKRNNAGKFLDSWYEKYSQFLVMNNGEFTFKRPHTESSILDIVLASTSCNAFDFDVLSWFHESDHFPVVVSLPKISKVSKVGNSRKYYRINDSEENVEKFHKGFVEWFEKVGLEFLCSLDIVDAWDEFFNVLIGIAIESCVLAPISKTSEKIYGVYDEEIEKLIKLKKSAMPKSPEWNRLNKELSSLIQNKKQTKWIEFSKSIGRETSPKEMWKLFANSRGKSVLNLAESSDYFKVEKAKEDFKQFSIPSKTIDLEKNMVFQTLVESHTAKLSSVDYVTSERLINALKDCSNDSSPGVDGLSYKFFKVLPMMAYDVMSELLNRCLQIGILPSHFKRCLQVALPKGNGEFRPITLLNTVSKILERVLKPILEDCLLKHIPDYQFGFRQKLGSELQLARFVNLLQKRKCEDKMFSLVLYFDIKKAYDRVCRRQLLIKLNKLGLPSELWIYIKNLIFGNEVSVVSRNAISKPYYPEEGVPQGGILSPLLWNIFFADIDEIASDPCSKFAFADDLAVVFSGKSIDDLVIRANSYVEKLCLWGKENRCELSIAKSKHMIISPNSRHFQREIVVRVDEIYCKIEQTRCYKYLGAWIDDRLSFDTWIDYICKETRRRIQFIERLITCFGLNRIVMERLYVGYVRGFLNYGASVWWFSASSANIELINGVDRRGLRMCVSAFPLTKTEDVLVESRLPSISLTVQRKVLREIIKNITWDEGEKFVDTLSYHLDLGTKSSCSRIPLFAKWSNTWMSVLDKTGGVGVWDKDELSKKLVKSLKSPQKIDFHYRKDAWEEKQLSRIRMSVLPTKVIMFRLKFVDNQLCRHCGIARESCEHLFESCTSLNRGGLVNFFSSYNLVFSFELLKYQLSIYPNHYMELANVVIEFIKMNKLWKKVKDGLNID